MRNQHRKRLSKHCAFRLDTANAPSHHTESVDHGRVRIRAYESVRIGGLSSVLLIDEHDLRNVLQINLMNDSYVRRNHPAILKCPLAPFEKDVTLTIALELAICIESEGAGAAELVDLHRVVNDKIHLLQGIDALWITTHFMDHVAHRRKIHDGGDSCEVLHQHARGPESDLLFGLRGDGRTSDCTNIGGRDRLSVFEAKQVFQHDLQRKRQLRYGSDAGLFRCLQREVIEFRVACLERRSRIKSVHRRKNCIKRFAANCANYANRIGVIRVIGGLSSDRYAKPSADEIRHRGSQRPDAGHAEPAVNKTTSGE